MNDVVDLERDRLHPLQAACGPSRAAHSDRRAALSAAAALGIVSLAVSLLLGAPFAVCAAAYLALNLLYSFRLKNVVIVDAISVSLGFVVRAVAGAVAIGVEFSDWLLICTILLALFLTLCKRRHELTSLNDSAVEHRTDPLGVQPLPARPDDRGRDGLVPHRLRLLHDRPRDRREVPDEPPLLDVPFVLYGIFRYLYLVHRKDQGGSPTDILLTDRPLLVAVALWALAIVVIVYSAAGAPMPLLR